MSQITLITSQVAKLPCPCYTFLMSAKIKFILVILLGTAITTVGSITLLSMAGKYPSADSGYYLFGGLGILVLFGGIALIAFLASKTAD